MTGGHGTFSGSTVDEKPRVLPSEWWPLRDVIVSYIYISATRETGDLYSPC